MSEALQATGLTKSYRTGRGLSPVVVVDDVSFSVPPGGSLGVVGESGSGKSTIARMVVGLLKRSFHFVSLTSRPQLWLLQLLQWPEMQ